MAITCEWYAKLGTMYHDETGITGYTRGNCTAVFTYGPDRNLADFICNIEHFRRVLGDNGGHWKEYKDIRLNGFFKEAWQIAKELNKQGIEFSMYYEVCKR